MTFVMFSLMSDFHFYVIIIMSDVIFLLTLQGPKFKTVFRAEDRFAMEFLSGAKNYNAKRLNLNLRSKIRDVNELHVGEERILAWINWTK